MSKKVILYSEEFTNKIFGILEIDGNKSNLGPLTLDILREYYDDGYELDTERLSIYLRTQLNKCFGPIMEHILKKSI